MPLSKEMAREYSRQYRLSHKEQILAGKRARYKKDPSKEKARVAIWRSNNKPHCNATWKAWQSKRLESIAARPRPEQCEVCEEKCMIWDVLSFDHDHSTGEFRGWLCAKCNVALGFSKDDSARLRKLADYLEKFQANNGVDLTLVTRDLGDEPAT